MVQLGDDPRQVAHTVVVGVGVRTRIDLVEDATLPPPIRVLA
jgi:azurin